MRFVVPLVHIATSENNTLEVISSVDSRENSVLSGGGNSDHFFPEVLL